MKEVFKIGDIKTYSKVVTPDDFANFHGKLVHAVCSTYALARDIEWTTRQFVLEMKDDDEEGIGTFISIDHKAPAFEGEEIEFSGQIEAFDGPEIICSVQAMVGPRLIASGRTGQKILKLEKIKRVFKRS
jgi:predicted thioesterase